MQGWIAHPFNTPRPVRAWLTGRGSLTRHLKSRCADFRVNPLKTGFARAHIDEHRILHLRAGAVAFVRDVLLSCHARNVVFAHSVLPRRNMRGGWSGIDRLGTRPLGEALFNNPRIRRETMHYRQIDVRHALFRAIQKRHALTTNRLWARRSIFRLHARALLVTEVFLPGINYL